jgi:hypothetical protein
LHTAPNVRDGGVGWVSIAGNPIDGLWDWESNFVAFRIENGSVMCGANLSEFSAFVAVTKHLGFRAAAAGYAKAGSK